MGTSVTASSSASAGSSSSHHAAPPRPGGSSSESVSINQLFSKFKSAGRSSSATPASALSATSTSPTTIAATSSSIADASQGGSSRSGTSPSFKAAALANKPSLANRTRSSPLLGTRSNPSSSNSSSSSAAPWSRAVSQSNPSHSASGAGASGGRAGGPGGSKSVHAPRPIQLPSRLYEQQHSGEVHKAKITLTRTSSSKSVVTPPAPTGSNDTAAAQDSPAVPQVSGDAAISAPNAAAVPSSSSSSSSAAAPAAWSHVAARASGVSKPATESTCSASKDSTDRPRPSSRTRSQSPPNRQWPPPRHAHDDAHAAPPPQSHRDQPDRHHESQDARFGPPPPGTAHGDRERSHDRHRYAADEYHGAPAHHHHRYGGGDDRQYRSSYHGGPQPYHRGSYPPHPEFCESDQHQRSHGARRGYSPSSRRDRSASPHTPARTRTGDAPAHAPQDPNASFVDEFEDMDPYADRSRGTSASHALDRDPPPAPLPLARDGRRTNDAEPANVRRWEPHHPLRGSARPATWAGAGAQRHRPSPRQHEHGGEGEEGGPGPEAEHGGVASERRGPVGGYRGPRYGTEGPGRDRRDRPRGDEYASEEAARGGTRTRSPRRSSPNRPRDGDRPRRRGQDGEGIEGDVQAHGQQRSYHEQGSERRGTGRGRRDEEQARPPRRGPNRGGGGQQQEGGRAWEEGEEPRERQEAQQPRRAPLQQERERDLVDRDSGAVYERMTSRVTEQVPPKLEPRNSAKSFRDLLEADAKSIEGQADWAAEDDSPDSPRAVDLSKYIKSKVQERQQNKAKSRQKLQHDAQQPVSPSDAGKGEADTMSPPPRGVGRRARSQSPDSRVRSEKRSAPSPKKSKTPPPSPPRSSGRQPSPVRQESPVARPAVLAPVPPAAATSVPSVAKPAPPSSSRPTSRPLSRAQSPARRSPSPPSALAPAATNPPGLAQASGIDTSRVTLLRRANPATDPSSVTTPEPQLDRGPAQTSSPSSSSAPSAFSPLVRPKPVPTASAAYSSQEQLYPQQQAPVQQHPQQPAVVKILQREPSASNAFAASSSAQPGLHAGAASLFSPQQTPSSSVHTAPLGPAIQSTLASIAARPAATSQPQVHQQHPHRSASPPRPAPLNLSNTSLLASNQYGAGNPTAMRQPFGNRPPTSAAVRPPPVSQPRSPFSPQPPVSAPGLPSTYGSGNANNWSSSAASVPSPRHGQFTSQPPSQSTAAQQGFSGPGRFPQQQSQFAPQQQPTQQPQQQSQPHFGPTGFGYNRTNQGRPQQQQQQSQVQLNGYPYQGQQQPSAHQAQHTNTFTPQPNAYQQPSTASGPGAGYQQQQHQGPRGQPTGQYGGTFASSPVSPSSPYQFQQAHQQYQNRTVQRGGSSSNMDTGMGAGGTAQQMQQQQQQQQYRQSQQMHGLIQNQVPPTPYSQAPGTGQHHHQHRQQHGQQQQFFQQQQQPPQQPQQQPTVQPTGPAPAMYPGYPQPGFMQFQPPQQPGLQPQFVPPPNPGQLRPNVQPSAPAQQQNQQSQPPQPPPPPHMMPAVPMGFMPVMPQPMPNQPFPPPPHMQFMPQLAMQVPFPLHMPMQMQIPMQPQPGQPQFAAPPQFQGPMPPNMQQPPMMFMAPGLQVPPHFQTGPMAPPTMVPLTSASPPYQANHPPGAASPTGAGPSASSPSQPQSSARGSGPHIAGQSVSIDTLDSVLERIKSTLAKPAAEESASAAAGAASPTVSLNTQQQYQQPTPSAITPTTTTRDFALDLGPAIVSPSMATKDIKDPEDSMVPRRQSVASNMAPGSAVQSRRPSAILSSVPNSTAASPTLGPIADQVQDDAASGGQGSSGGGPNLWASPSLRTLTVGAQETVHNSVKHLLRDSDDGEEAVPGVDIKVGMADLGEDAGASSTSLADKGRPAVAADEARREQRGSGRAREPGPQRTGDQSSRRDHRERQTSGEHAGRPRGEQTRNRDARGGRGASSNRRDDGGRGDGRSRGSGRQAGADNGSHRSHRSSTSRGGRGRSQATES